MASTIYTVHDLAEHLEWSLNYTYRRLAEEGVDKDENGRYTWTSKKALRKVASKLAQ